MKTPLTQKLSLSLNLAIAALIMLPSFTALATRTAFAGDPFDVPGIERTLTPEAQLQSLQAFADTSKARLDQVLLETEGLLVGKKNKKFKEAIADVVRASYAHKQGSELMMRTVLIQALDLTYGIPDEGGAGVRRPGVLDSLDGNLYPNVKMAIMEDSIHLALDFYMDDRKAVQEGSLGNLPLNRLARDRLNRARDRWLPMLGDEWNPAYDLSYAMLFQWLGSVKTEQNLGQKETAEEITQVNALLKSLPAYGVHPVEQTEIENAVRKMRRTTRWLTERLNAQKM